MMFSQLAKRSIRGLVSGLPRRRCVLNASYGKAFHSDGAKTEKDLAPYVFKLYDGVNRRCLDDERN